MSLTPEQQIKELIENSENILILTPEYSSGDAFGAAIGLGNYLEKLGKTVTLSGDSTSILSKQFSFLSLPKNMPDSISGVREFILSFNTERNDIVSIRTERDKEHYNIFITPEKGSIDPRDFSFIPAKFSFELVFVIGAPDKESLGKIFETNPDIFYEVPIVNIDNHVENDHFGQINIIEITASSSSEIVANLLEKIGTKRLDETVAGALLAGIISATESFQKKNTTPGSLHVASRLMDYGANQQEIILHLFNAQPFSLLKLWGRIMAGLKWDAELKFMWAIVTPEDIVQSRTKIETLPVILEKIRSHSSVGSIFSIFYLESSSRVRVICKCHNGNILGTIAKTLPESKLRGDTLEYGFPANSLGEAEFFFLEKLRSIPSLRQPSENNP